MPNSDLLPSLPFKLNENQLALEAIDKNEELIQMTLVVLMTPKRLLSPCGFNGSVKQGRHS